VETDLSPSPVPHFTVSKVTVPKPDHSYEVRFGDYRQAVKSSFSKVSGFSDI